MMGIEWRGMLAPLGVPTGDGRRFLASGMTNRELPLPLKWQRADVGGHDTSVTIGSCYTINYGTVAEAIENDWISAKCIEDSNLDGSMMAVWGMGRLFSDANSDDMPRLAEDVSEVMLLLDNKVVGPSVDPGSCRMAIAVAGSEEPLTDQQIDEIIWTEESDSDEPVELETLFTEYQIAAATLVSVPAFQECRPFELIKSDAEVTLTAAIRSTGWGLPFADRGLEWDSVAADKRIAEDAGLETDSPNWQGYASAFLYQDDEADPQTKGAYGFQIVDIIDGLRVIVPRAVFAVAATLEGARGGTIISEADQDAMKTVVSGLYARMAKEWEDDGVVAPWDKSMSSLIAAMSAIPATVDRALFDQPKLDNVTPITITDDGRVFGHIATHDTCHVGFRSECVTAPMSARNYSDFHRYAAPVDGDILAVGRITVGHGQHVCKCGSCRGANDDHACLAMTASSAIAHYDRMSTVAWVRAYEDVDNNAIVISGVLASDASVADIACLTGARVSGDWRPIAGRIELVEVLSLARERPGFPLPMARMVNGSVAALTAAGTVRPSVVKPGSRMLSTQLDVDALSERIAQDVADRVISTVERFVAPTATTVTPMVESVVDETDEVDGAVRASVDALMSQVDVELERSLRLDVDRLVSEI